MAGPGLELDASLAGSKGTGEKGTCESQRLSPLRVEAGQPPSEGEVEGPYCVGVRKGAESGFGRRRGLAHRGVG